MINPRRACAMVTVVVLCVYLSVCLSVCYRSSCFSVRLHLQPTILRGFSLDFDSWIFGKPSVQKLWREKPNMQMNCQPFSRTFRIDEAKELLVKDNWSIKCCFSATYWCKWPKGTEIDAATAKERRACERARCACVEL